MKKKKTFPLVTEVYESKRYSYCYDNEGNKKHLSDFAGKIDEAINVSMGDGSKVTMAGDLLLQKFYSGKIEIYPGDRGDRLDDEEPDGGGE